MLLVKCKPRHFTNLIQQICSGAFGFVRISLILCYSQQSCIIYFHEYAWIFCNKHEYFSVYIFVCLFRLRTQPASSRGERRETGGSTVPHGSRGDHSGRLSPDLPPKTARPPPPYQSLLSKAKPAAEVGCALLFLNQAITWSRCIAVHLAVTVILLLDHVVHENFAHSQYGHDMLLTELTCWRAPRVWSVLGIGWGASFYFFVGLWDLADIFGIIKTSDLYIF